MGGFLFFKRFLRNKLSVFGLAFVAALVVVSLAASHVRPYDPLKISISSRTQTPSKTHIFGTDHFGRDIFSRVLSGAKISLTVGIVSVALGALVGILLGSLAGYFGGWLDYGITLVMDAIISFPATLLAIGLMSVMGLGVANIIIALAFIGIPHYGRVMRGAVLSIREKEYVEAARASGSGHGKIILLHVLPNAMAPLIVVTTIGVANAILIEAALSFLGLGVPPPAPSWGNMLADGRNFLTQAPWMTIFPGLAISLTVLGFNTLGDGL
ncbi:MAG TPA: ABC transporter permease, partial [Thermodesulfobacteriota bacterium]|nr:ABC transporter permease [Thermodesulfobacteriota bacterium]